MKCLEIDRLQDFAPNTPELQGTVIAPRSATRGASLCIPPLEIPVYGPVFVTNSVTIFMFLDVFHIYIFITFIEVKEII
jgi:hypothetical protein